MACDRFQTDGMKLLDGEMTSTEEQAYEEHVKGCADCTNELRDLGRVVGFTNEMRLRAPDEDFWEGYWRSVYRRLERGTGFLLLIVGVAVMTLWVIYEFVTSPEFLTIKGIAISAILLGLVIVFLSVVRERYHESKDDPYKEIEQ